MASGASKEDGAAAFGVEGMTCGNCVGHVEGALRRVPGVFEASMDLATNRADVRFDLDLVDKEKLFAAVRKSGYGAVELRDDFGDVKKDFGESLNASQNKEKEKLKLKDDFFFTLFFGIPLLLLSILPMVLPAFVDWQMRLNPSEGFWNLILMALATPVVFGPGRLFFKHSWKSLIALNPDWNILVMISTGSTYFYSAGVTFIPSYFPSEIRHVYFTVSVVVIALGLWEKRLRLKTF